MTLRKATLSVVSYPYYGMLSTNLWYENSQMYSLLSSLSKWLLSCATLNYWELDRSNRKQWNALWRSLTYISGHSDKGIRHQLLHFLPHAVMREFDHQT